MITTLARLSRLRAVLGRQGNPYLRGRAMQLTGTALLADGLVGLENPFDGRDKRAGILGSLVAVGIVAVMLFFVGFAVRSSDPFPDGATAAGTVTSSERGTGNQSNVCSATVSYTVDGTGYEVPNTSSSTELCSAAGQQVEVSYRPSDPAAGRPQLSGTSTLLRVVTMVLWVVLVLFALTVLVRAAEIVVGAWLVLRGRSLVRSVEPVPAAQVLEELRAAWTGPRADVPGRG